MDTIGLLSVVSAAGIYNSVGGGDAIVLIFCRQILLICLCYIVSWSSKLTATAYSGDASKQNKKNPIISNFMHGKSTENSTKCTVLRSKINEILHIMSKTFLARYTSSTAFNQSHHSIFKMLSIKNAPSSIFLQMPLHPPEPSSGIGQFHLLIKHSTHIKLNVWWRHNISQSTTIKMRRSEQGGYNWLTPHLNVYIFKYYIDRPYWPLMVCVLVTDWPPGLNENNLLQSISHWVTAVIHSKDPICITSTGILLAFSTYMCHCLWLVLNCEI